jgi:hypothetical protein
MSTSANNSSNRELNILENNTIKLANICTTPVEIDTPCLICGEGIPSWFGNYTPNICKECRDAVMAMRKKMEGEPE